MATSDRAAPFGVLLVQYRAAAGLSQKELAERAGLSRRGVSDLERGARRSPHPMTVRRLAEALGLDESARNTLFAAVRTLTNAQTLGPTEAGPVTPLPAPISRFVGRERDIDQVQRRLADSRLVTLVGPGGIGKTRLALEVARGIKTASGAQVTFVELAALADRELVPQAVAASLGIPERPGRPLFETLVAALRVLPMLLILDNCEHVLAACAGLADRLLQTCTGLRVLATSREALGIGGEIIWLVPSLSIPQDRTNPAAEQVARTEAVQLFIERAQAIVPGFALSDGNAAAIAQLCRKLDGIPLALELAAARILVLSVGQIAERLDDALGLLTTGSRLAPGRQQTLRAALAWSYSMLTPAEQLTFDRLSVFAGGWTLEAAEQACSGPKTISGPARMSNRIERLDVLDLLTALVGKSLVIADRSADGPVRYRMLETLRQYGWERLSERGEAEAISDLHAEFFLALAEQTQPELLGHAGSVACDRLEQEHDNLRTALHWFLDMGTAERAELLAGALGRFWLIRGYLTEGESWLVRVLALAGAERRTGARARCLYALASLQLNQGDYAAAEAANQEALAIWREVGDVAGESWTLFGLGQVARLRGQYISARALLSAGVVASQAAGQAVAEANCLSMLAELAYGESDDGEALVQAEAALVRSTAIGWRPGMINAQRMLGQVRMAQRDYSAAKALLEASLAISRQLGSRGLSVQVLVRLGELAIELGDVEASRQWLAESVGLIRDLGDRPGVARVLEACVQLAAIDAQPGIALRMAAAAAALRTASAAPLPPRDGAALEQRLASARASLGGTAAERAWAEGAALSSDDAMACALSLLRAGAQVATTARDKPDRLSSREREVALLVARGLSNPQIAVELIIGERTVQTHVSNILSKLGLSSRVQVAGWVAEHHQAEARLHDP